MSIYWINPYARRMARRHWMQRLSEEWPSEQGEVIFPVDVLASENGYTITALLPGVKAEDLNIQVVDNRVSIQGTLKIERDEKAEYLLAELPSGRFCKTIDLPEAVDSSKAEASLKDGVLTLSIPKAEHVRPKTIKVTAH
ncbi:MAG: Hsp20/alpha crystallin family protein [Chloroflexota bacterium]